MEKMIYQINDQTPVWIKICFSKLGIKKTFDSEEITVNQIRGVNTIEAITSLIELGEVEPILTVNDVIFRKVEKT